MGVITNKNLGLDIGRRISLAFKKRNISREAVAHSLKMSPSSFHQYIIQGIQPSSESLIKICTKYNISSDYLLGLCNIDTYTPVVKCISGFLFADQTNDIFYKNYSIRLSNSEYKLFKTLIKSSVDILSVKNANIALLVHRINKKLPYAMGIIKNKSGRGYYHLMLQ